MKKFYLHTILFFLHAIFVNCLAQNKEIDSLKRVLITSPEDTNKVNDLIDLCKLAIDNDFYDTAYRYSLISKNTAQKINYKKGLALAYSLIANIYYHQGNNHKSLENNLEALKIREPLGDIKGMANSYNNIGNVYMRLKIFNESIKNHFAALAIREKIKDSINIGYSFNNIGNVYRLQGKLADALKYHFAALEIKQLGKNKKEITYSLNNIGIVYTDMGNYKEAIKYHTQALALAKEINSLENIEITYIDISRPYLKLKDYKMAEDCAMKALTIATDIGDTETIIDANMLLSILYEETGNFKKSLDYYHNYIIIRDSIYNDGNAKNSIQAQLQFDFDKKEMLAKKELEKKEIEANAESKKQKWILFLVSCILILAVFFAIFTYRSYLQKQKANKIILLQKLEVEKQRNKTEEKNKDITSSITYAKRIQEAILPSEEIIKEKFPNSFILYKPKDIVAGDFYWVSDAVTKYQESFMMVAVADCTGHGVPGALMSVIGNNFLRICEREPTVNRPSEALDFINVGISKTLRQEYSKSTIQDGMDMVFVAIDYNTLKLHFAGAKNSICIVSNGILTEYKGDKHPIGAYVGNEMKKFTNHTIPIQQGDCVYLFTDGYADQFGGPNGKKFMYSRLKKVLAKNSHLPMEEQLQLLDSTFEEWKGANEQVDDVCVFGIKI
ncbi:MAG: tetratricopeptide repeat protein [Bacteroidia bacterium]|nr:tetratricopeptide repeat protein [Bacteroidia bacterium]